MTKYHYFNLCSLICFIASLFVEQSHAKVVLGISSIIYTVTTVYLALKDK